LQAANERAEKKAAEAEAAAVRAKGAEANATLSREEAIKDLNTTNDTLRKQGIKFGELQDENDKLRGVIQKLRDCVDQLRKDSLYKCPSEQ
jgi:hypothetical protein